VLLHGFTQNARCWGSFGTSLAKRQLVVAADLPGHGDSAGVRANLWSTAELVAESFGRASYVGYSLGGRVLLHLAIARPEVIRSVVLIGATGGIEDAGERAMRVESDEALARQLDAAEGDRSAFERFMHEWLAGPLFAGLTAESACVDARLRNDPRGLASSLRLCGTGAQEPLWDRLAEITAPVLVLAGERDERFAALGRRLAGSIGANASFEIVSGAHHACHLEKPSETAEIVEAFLSKLPSSKLPSSKLPAADPE
jgi:2-succinyl-6-hydroxy-2,4-cyclohexadiene-1-carboxylate synthase